MCFKDANQLEYLLIGTNKGALVVYDLDNKQFKPIQDNRLRMKHHSKIINIKKLTSDMQHKQTNTMSVVSALGQIKLIKLDINDKVSLKEIKDLSKENTSTLVDTNLSI